MTRLLAKLYTRIIICNFSIPKMASLTCGCWHALRQFTAQCDMVRMRIHALQVLGKVLVLENSVFCILQVTTPTEELHHGTTVTWRLTSKLMQHQW